MARTTDTISSATAAAALREWLIAGPAQLKSGPEAGAVAGTIDASGHADYAYGEITGYYLHWLASPHLRRVVPEFQLIAKANSAIAWCERRFTRPEAVPTRIALHDANADWRNDATFCFDLAMLVGGIVVARRRELISTPHVLLADLLSALTGFAGDNGLVPAKASPHSADPQPLPARWSTRSGPFLVKAAARILSAQALTQVPPALEQACHAQLERFAENVPRALDEPLHPTLYFLEGELALACERNGRTATLLKSLLKLADDAGNLPEAVATPAIHRADIVAQALRVGLLLRACGERKAPADGVLDGLAQNLIQRVRPDGGLAFRENASPPQLNVWCAMFAEQALAWHAQWRGTRTLNANAWDVA
jgi:hypothetical protein